MFHVISDTKKSFENFEAAKIAAEAEFAQTTATTVVVKYGSNYWVHFYRQPAGGWQRVIAARGQENLAAYSIVYPQS